MATRRGPDNSVRVSINGTVNAVNWANVFWCQLTTSATPTQAMLDTWLTAFQSAYKTAFAPRIATISLFAQAQATLFLPGGTILPSIVAMTGAGTGGGAGAEYDATCSIVSWQTGVYWRGGKPRTYLPTPTTAGLANGKALTSGEQTALNTAGAGFITAVNALTATNITATVLGFTSFRSGGADRVPPVFFPYIGTKVHPRLGTQRRRLGRWLP